MSDQDKTKLCVDLTKITDTSRCSASEIVQSLERQLKYWRLKKQEADRGVKDWVTPEE